MKRWARLLLAVALSLPLSETVRAQGQPPPGDPPAGSEAPAQPEAPDTDITPVPPTESSTEPPTEPVVTPTSPPANDGVEPPDPTTGDADPVAPTPIDTSPPVPDPQPDVEKPAPPAPRLGYNASFLTRYESRNHYDTLGASRGRFSEGDMTAYRARVGAELPTVSLGSGVSASAIFTVQAAGFLGSLGTVIGDAPFGVHQGYGHIEGRRFSVDLGRFVMLYGDAVVIGNANWNQIGRSFEGVRASLLGAGGQYRVDLFATQTNEGRPMTGAGDGDSYFYGAYAMLGPTFSSTMAVDVYAFGLSYLETPPEISDPGPPPLSTQMHATTATLGLRIKDRRGAWDYRLETGIQGGTALSTPGTDSPNVFAFHGDAAVGYSVGGFRAALQATYASGDDPDTPDRYEAWNDLFPNRHKWLGNSDVFGNRINLYAATLRLKYVLGPTQASEPGQPAGPDRAVFKLDTHIFGRPQPVNDNTGYAGTEINAIAIKPLGKGLSLSGMLAVFQPDEAIYGTDQLATYGELQLRLDIK